MEKNKIISISMLVIFLISSFSFNSALGLNATDLLKDKSVSNDKHIKIISDTLPKTPDCLTLEWTYDPLGEETWGSISLEDIDDDGYLEIMFSSGFEQWEEAKPGWTYVLRHDGSVQSGFPKLTNSEPNHVPTAADIDPGYPGLEVITTSQNPHSFIEYTYAWHSDGTDVSGWPILGGSSSASASLGDIDGDGLLEIISPIDCGGPEDRGLHVRNGDGSELDGWPSYYGIDQTYSTSSIADVDNDGNTEIIYAAGGKLYVLHNDGTLIDGWPQNSSRTNPAIADLNNDGNLEIFSTYGSSIYAYHNDGTVVDGWPQNISYPGSNSISICDLNDDEELEIVAQSGKYVYVFNSSGELLPGWPHEGYFSYCGHPPVLGDIDGDNSIDIVLTRQIGIDAFHYDGQRVDGFPLGFFNKPDLVTRGSPALGDIDKDGKLELIAVVLGDVMVWECEGYRIGWPMFNHDIYHTGSYQNIVSINRAPNPPVISGKKTGKKGNEYEFEISTTDYEDDNISYYIDWGDNTFTDWTEYFPSGTIINKTHTWDSNGIFKLRAKAKDINGTESEWSDPFRIVIIKIKDVKKSLFLTSLIKILKKYPLINALLKN